MNKKTFSQAAEDYRRIEQAIHFIETSYKTQPTLDDIARSANLSKYHFQRLFKRWAGISPVQFMQYLTLEYTKRKLSEAGNLLDTSFDAGLSGPGRLHDLFVNFEAMTPGEFKKLGRDLTIDYGYHPTPFGECLIATTDRGICHLAFIDGSRRPRAFQDLKRKWPKANLAESVAATEPVVHRIFDPVHSGKAKPFHLLLQGTNFQVNVWRALIKIPRGTVVSYGDIAAYIGRPDAVRAAANAIAVNPVAYLIPCHRVIARTGLIHGYRWGIARKKAILIHEAAGIEAR